LRKLEIPFETAPPRPMSKKLARVTIWALVHFRIAWATWMEEL
jgi:hypothetical protein